MTQTQRILLASVGSYGDVLPFVRLGKALVERGHDVTLITSGYFSDVVEQAGIKIAAAGTADDYIRYVSNPDLVHPVRGLFLTRKILSSILQPIYEYIRNEWQFPGAVLAASPYCFSARIARETTNLRLVTVNMAPISMGSTIDPPTLLSELQMSRVPRALRPIIGRLMHGLTDRVLGGPVNRFRRQLGLRPMQRLMQWWQSPDSCMCLFPSWFAKQVADWPCDPFFAGFPLDNPVEEAIDAELEPLLGPKPSDKMSMHYEPSGPLLFYPGSNSGRNLVYANICSQACEQLGSHGILVVPASTDTDNFRSPHLTVKPFVPMMQVLPRVSAVIHHGGIGTVANCLHAGRPQIIRPCIVDQPDNAARVADLGVGTILSPSRFSVPNLVKAIQQVRGNDAIAVRCRELQSRVQKNRSLALAAEFLESQTRAA